MVAFAAWLPDVRVHVALCPEPVILHELRRAAQEFLTQAHAWRETLTAIDAPADGQVALTSTNGDVVAVKSLRYLGARLNLATLDEMDAEDDLWRDRQGTPHKYVPYGPAVQRLVPTPGVFVSGALQAEVALAPKEGADNLPDALAYLRTAIVDGAKANLFAYKDKPWTDYALSDRHAGLFENAIDREQLKIARAYGRGRIAGRPGWC